MSLQVWINGIYENSKGLSDVVISYTGVPAVDLSNVITESCLLLGDDCYNINTGYGNGLSTDEKSIAIWVKPTNTNDSKMLLRTTGTTPGRLYLGIKNSTWNLAYGDNTWGYTSNAPVLVNEWQHICITIKHGIATLYYNGEFIETKSGDDFIMPSNIILSPSGSVFTGFYDDIRIYDHCLSSKEVYDITKGLVLHYKLDDPEILKSKYSTIMWNQLIENGNFATDPTNIQGWYLGYGSSFDNTNPDYIKYSGNHYSYYRKDNLVSGHKYYLYCRFRKTDISSSTTPYIYWTNFDSGATNPANTDGSWTVYKKIKTSTGDGQTANYGIIRFFTGGTSLDIDKTHGIQCIDLTQMFGAGNEPTIEEFEMMFSAPYYSYNTGTQMTLDYKTVTDSSGYNNHGIITGSLSVTNDTPRYNYATHFDGSSYIKILRSNFSNYYQHTISFWANWDSIPSGQSVLFVDSGTNTGFGLVSTGILLTTSGAGNSYTYPKSGLVANTWYHFVIVITGTTERDLYINGVKQTPTSNQSTWTYNVNELQIGKRSTTSDGFVGKMSDFRIYAKALSGDDVKELYDTAAFIDNIGNLECYKISEEDVSSQEVMKTGVVKTPMFIESNERLKVLDDGSVWLQILHHNNPALHLFTQTNCWFYNDNRNLFSMLQILKDEPWITSLTEFEFLACEKLTSSSTEAKYRWKQTSNPALSSTLSGYELISGSPGRDIGLMNKGTYGAMHNGGSWWCCCGSYSAYSGGIPGFGGIVTSGYLDLYIKIPFDILNNDISEQAKFFKKSIVTNQLLEV